MDETTLIKYGGVLFVFLLYILYLNASDIVICVNAVIIISYIFLSLCSFLIEFLQCENNYWKYQPNNSWVEDFEC